MIYCEARPLQNADDPSVHRVFRGRASAHLMADTDEELIAYAVSIGMQRSWIQHPGRWDCHFDITGSRLARVMRDARVVKLDRRTMVERWQAKRAAMGRPQTEGGAEWNRVRPGAGTLDESIIPGATEGNSAAGKYAPAAEQIELFGGAYDSQ